LKQVLHTQQFFIKKLICCYHVLQAGEEEVGLAAGEEVQRTGDSEEVAMGHCWRHSRGGRWHISFRALVIR